MYPHTIPVGRLGGSISLGFFAILLAGNGCRVCDEHASQANGLSGKPVWLPLGAPFRTCRPNTIVWPPRYDEIIAEVHHASHRIEVQKQALSFVPQSRWFLGFPKTIARPEFLARLDKLKRKGGSVTPDPAGELRKDQAQVLVPWSPPMPEGLDSLPTVDQGVSLSLEIEPAASPRVLRFVLVLEAHVRAVWREVEHRWTNVVPFLFAVYADGTPVAPDMDAMQIKNGGANHLEQLLQESEAKPWELRVNVGSLDPFLGDVQPRTLSIVAAFSERQHGVVLPGTSVPLFSRGYPIADPLASLTGQQPECRQILVRSNVVRLVRRGRSWQVLGGRQPAD